MSLFSFINLFFSGERVEFEMALSKQRNIDGECRVFQDKWTNQYFFIVTERKSSVFILFGNGGSHEAAHTRQTVQMPSNTPHVESPLQSIIIKRRT